MIANAGTLRRDIGDFAETAVALDILRTLDLVRFSDGPKMTCIAGIPGCGKTTTTKQYCKDLGRDGIYIDIASGEGTAWNFAKRLAHEWIDYAPSLGRFNTLTEARMTLSSAVGKGSLLVIDEAQHLHQRNNKNGKKTEAFEWARALAEKGEFDLVFCGDMRLPAVLDDIPQLKSRMLRPVIVTEVSRADVAALVEGTPYAIGPAVDALHSVARMAHGLRSVEIAVSAALSSATGKGEHPTLAHLKGAIIDMKLAPKGGK
ncbi:AAA family ATPase [Rhodovulum sp. P5]|uniref:AAA family ATPase n=1 Tax=Rhodovulum sp. P5 TaxID=1564506 RepID=UPI0015618DEB|nr:AAA family ATPase [Rhodovulum sp. P5]